MKSRSRQFSTFALRVLLLLALASAVVAPVTPTSAQDPDTTPPETYLETVPPAATESTEATFGFSADDLDATFLCSLDGSDWESCISPFTYTDHATTPHQFGVSAVDAAGNADLSPEIHDWTISPPADTTAPTTTITGGPEDTSDNTAVSFEFAANDSEVSFACALDGSDFTPCASPAEYDGLAEGDHTFAVRATDAQGNVEDPPATSSWTVAWEPLIETFESNDLAFWTEAQGDGLYLQDDLVASGEYAVRGTSTGQATVLVKTLDLPQQEIYYRTKFHLVDRGDNPVTLLQLWNANGDLLTTLYVAADGRFAHQVGDDGTTQTSSVPVTESVWHEVEIRVGVDGANSVVEVWYDGNHLDDLNQSASLGSSPVVHVSLGNGATGRSYDVAFDDIAVDTAFIPADIEAPLVTAPETTIDGAPAASTTETTATFIFSADASDASFACSLDGSAFTPCASPVEFADVGLGPHRFEVQATNAQGLTDETPASHKWTVAPPPDTTAPLTTIGSGPDVTTKATTATLTFSADEEGSTFACALDSGTFQPCASPQTYSDLTEGTHVFQVQATDAAGNTDETPASATWTVDLTAPTTSIDTAPSGSVAVTTATITFSAEDGTTFTCAVDGGESAPCASPLDLTGLADGQHSVAVVATDAAGNADASPATSSWTVDTAAPETSLSSTPGSVTNSTTADFAFTSPDTGATFACRMDGGAFAPCTSPANYTGLAASLHTFQVQATDAAGNTDVTPATYNWTVDSTAPDTTINGPSGTTNARTATIAFSSEANATFQCALDNAAFAGCVAPVTLNDLSDGQHTYAVRAIDAAGNPDGSPATSTWTVDATAPTVSVSPAGGTYTAPQTVNVTSSEPGAVHYTTDGSEPTTASTAYSSPVFIAGSTTLKFFAITPDGRTSAIAQQTYTIQVRGYRDFNYGTSHSAPTSKGPQSKLWYADGKWWGVLLNPTSRFFQIYRLDTTTQMWTDTGTIVETRLLGNGGFGKFDVLWDGSKLYVVTHRFGTSGDVRAKVLRFSYAGGAYTQDYATLNVTPAGVGPEVVTITKDTTGALWLSWTHNNKVYVTHTTSNEQTWVTPYILPVNGSSVAVDDVSAIVAFGGKIGVMWSNQAEGNPHQQDPNLMDRMYFAYHVDGAADTAWAQEVAYDLPGNVEAADDHINLKVDSSGRVYAAAKTSLNASSEPLINLYVRGTGGTWSSHLVSPAGFQHTRPIVQLDEAAGRVYVFASRYEAGSVIYVKSASMTNPVFPGGLGTPIIASQNDPKINNVSAATGLVILASDDSTRTYLHNFLPLGTGGAGGTTMAAATIGTPPGGDPKGLSESVSPRWAATTRVSVAMAAPFDGALDGQRAISWPLLAILAAAAFLVYPSQRPLPGRRSPSESRPVRRRHIWPEFGYPARSLPGRFSARVIGAA